MRIGYLVPEFPGQTHSFFWRELGALRERGVEADLISTRRPTLGIVSHSWAIEAEKKTLYLADTPWRSIISLCKAAWASPLGLYRCVKSIGLADETSRLRLCGLLCFAAKLAAIANRRHWEHLHVHSCADAANIAMLAALLSGVRYSLTLHGPLHDYGGNQRQKWSRAEFGIVITNKLHAEVHQLLAGSLPRVEIAPMGVNPIIFNRKRPYALPVSNAPYTVFSCGRLNFCKGHADLIKAISMLRERGIDARLTIAGEDELGGRGYHRDLSQLIQALGLEACVTLLGAVPERKIIHCLERAHVFALLSLEEPLGVAIMEAMAMEVPVVATRGGGVMELVEHGVDGLLVEPQNPAKAADALELMATDANLTAQFRVRARQKVLQNFDSRRSAEVLLNAMGGGTGRVIA